MDTSRIPSLALPTGGGALRGLGESFGADPFTGSGRASIPITLPPGRAGLTPTLALQYASGNGQGPFGLGWSIGLPGVARRTSRGVPRYNEAATLVDEDERDVFTLSGAEDLVPVAGAYPGRRRYRPRAEGAFARIEHLRDDRGDTWEVLTRDGMRTRYGTPRPSDAPADWHDPAATFDPADPRRVFAWQVTQTSDSFGNVVRYHWRRDHGEDASGHLWDRPLIDRIEYADHGERDAPSFLVEVIFDYESRPDATSEHRAGFEVRTTLRCRAIRIVTHAADGRALPVRDVVLGYEQAPFNGASLLTRVQHVGWDDDGQAPPDEQMPPLEFGYTTFDVAGRRFEPVTGDGLPVIDLRAGNLALVDLQGNGLPDLLQLGDAPRHWRNLGGGRFDVPRAVDRAPPHALDDPGVALIDANGNGRVDLMAARDGGYYPTRFAPAREGVFDARGLRRYPAMPAALLEPRGTPPRWVDLDGDGISDLLHAGTRLEATFNARDPRRAWQRTHVFDAAMLDGAPDVDFAQPIWHLADMSGDGLSDLVLVRNGHVAYWPNLGHGHFGRRVTMRRAPRLPADHNPARLLLLDADGDGAADLVYVEPGRVLLWANLGGDAFAAQPLVIRGTPSISDDDQLTSVDLMGEGTAGLLWSSLSSAATGRDRAMFLAFCGATKPYLLDRITNGFGGERRMTYRSSTGEWLRDAAHAATRWRTPLPFPVHVVVREESIDHVGGHRVATDYRYRHGLWDGHDREFRGFARVDRIEVGTLPGSAVTPLLERTWFHVGPIDAIDANPGTSASVVELMLDHEHWAGDPSRLERPAPMREWLASLPVDARRDALRCFAGQRLRSELYALDGDSRADRPYDVTEQTAGLREVARADTGTRRVFHSHALASRHTRWERGDDPMTSFAFDTEPDAYGLPTASLSVAVPRGRDPWRAGRDDDEPLLATLTRTVFAQRDDATVLLVERVATSSRFEVLDEPVDGQRMSVMQLRDAAFAGRAALRVLAHDRHHYDGAAFEGLPIGQVGDHGLLSRSESLAFDDAFLDRVFGDGSTVIGARPPYLRIEGGDASAYPAGLVSSLPPAAGYVFHPAEGDSPAGWYVVDSLLQWDVQLDGAGVARGLLVAERDAAGARSTIDYDAYALLPVRVTNPAGLAVEASYHPRLLEPQRVVDINGNVSRVAFGATGLVTAQWRQGKDGSGDGEQPGVRVHHDLLAYVRRGQPVQSRTVQRVWHDTDARVPADARDATYESVTFADGFGRVIQTRRQADDIRWGAATFGGELIPPQAGEPAAASIGRRHAAGEPVNVVVDGWALHDHRGRVVQAWEPFFAQGFDYAPPTAAQLGSSLRTTYDARGEVVRVVAPDGGEQRIVRGVPVDLADPDHAIPTPWVAFTYDANDNAARTSGERAHLTAPAHWNTPSNVVFDALGRTVTQVQRNGADAATDWYVTTMRLDIEGRLLSITDPLGREAWHHAHDLLGRRWMTTSIDHGIVVAVHDALGRVPETRDAKGAWVLRAHDPLGRLSALWARDASDQPITLRQRVSYGDAGSPDQPPAERDAARANNLLGQPVRHHDEAGVVALLASDFAGRPLVQTRRVVGDAPLLAAYDGAADRGWRIDRFVMDWQPAAGQTFEQREAELLDAAEHRTDQRHDALGRVVERVLPAAPDGVRHVMHASFGTGGGLDAIRLDDAVHVERIVRDASGRRTLVAYGNGVMTRHAWDEASGRLLRTLTQRFTRDTDIGYASVGASIQDIGYAHDFVGNLVAMRDRTPGCGVRGNEDALDRAFAHDPVYRLVSATGREVDAGTAGAPWSDEPRGTDLTQARHYTQQYAYDAVGHMRRLSHRHADGGWSRDYVTTGIDNRLVRLQVGTVAYAYAYDAAGNLVRESDARHLEWDHANRMVTFRTQLGDAEPSVHAQYLHDAAGQRVVRLVRRQGGAVDVRHAVAPDVEIARFADGARNQVVHIGDGGRLATQRFGGADPGDTLPALQYVLGDHLGSTSRVLDAEGRVLHAEDYTPFGESSFGSAARPRWRFGGKERDAESGLSHHGARAYLPWVCRWASCDPMGAAEGMNPYAFVGNRPMVFADPSGLQAQAAGKKQDDAQLLGGALPTVSDSSDAAGAGAELAEKAAKAALDRARAAQQAAVAKAKKGTHGTRGAKARKAQAALAGAKSRAAATVSKVSRAARAVRGGGVGLDIIGFGADFADRAYGDGSPAVTQAGKEVDAVLASSMSFAFGAKNPLIAGADAALSLAFGNDVPTIGNTIKGSSSNFTIAFEMVITGDDRAGDAVMERNEDGTHGALKYVHVMARYSADQMGGSRRAIMAGENMRELGAPGMLQRASAMAAATPGFGHAGEAIGHGVGFAYTKARDGVSAVASGVGDAAAYVARDDITLNPFASQVWADHKPSWMPF